MSKSVLLISSHTSPWKRVGAPAWGFLHGEHWLRGLILGVAETAEISARCANAEHVATWHHASFFTREALCFDLAHVPDVAKDTNQVAAFGAAQLAYGAT